MPSAAGGRERPTSPATAISVSTYGSAWKSVAVLGEKTGSRCARALEKPNSSAAASAPPGRHLPKMTAARPMNPRPAVMFWLKEWTKADGEKAAPHRGEPAREDARAVAHADRRDPRRVGGQRVLPHGA